MHQRGRRVRLPPLLSRHRHSSTKGPVASIPNASDHPQPISATASRQTLPVAFGIPSGSPSAARGGQARGGRRAPPSSRPGNPPWKLHDLHRPRPEPLIRDIVLSRFALAPENVRKTPPDPQADAELKASIAALGLLENLVVRSDSSDADRAHAPMPVLPLPGKSNMRRPTLAFAEVESLESIHLLDSVDKHPFLFRA